MDISQSDIENILREEKWSISLATLMVKLSLQQSNINRLRLTSLIKWNPNIKRTYMRVGTETQTFYYLKQAIEEF